MSDRERVRRPDLPRTEPVRSGAGLFHGSGASEPFAWPDDPVGRAVKAGRDVVESAVRRGFGVGRDTGFGTAPASAAWSPGQFVDAMTGMASQWAQWMDAWTQMARTAFAGRDGFARDGAAASASAPAPVRVTVELRSARAASVQLELAALPDAPLELHGLLAPPAAGAPPITDVQLAARGDGVVISIGAIDAHPAATYVGAVLAGGRACGTLTVQLR